ncbi:MAG: 1-deoxy-D-xylulose-5-phosphate reductoisomerase [Pseudomonadota bacterium]
MADLTAAVLSKTRADIEKDTTQPATLDQEVQSVTILGATGSIGSSTLDLMASHHQRFALEAVTADTNAVELAQIAKTHGAKRAVIADAAHYTRLKTELSGTGIEAMAGPEALIEAACIPVDCVMASIVGAAGLPPAFAALKNGGRIGLANKECLVCAGDIFMKEVERHGVELLPVDSEHSAGFQALGTAEPETIEKITLTASGGPFRSWSADQIAKATRDEALKHPNWSMGAKITIDSASMMNKGLELIEAYHLFPVNVDQLDTVVHPQSIIHCLVSYCDGSVLAQLSEPDMRTPIALALSWPTRMDAPTKRLSLADIGTLTFEAPDPVRFPALRIAKDALHHGGSAPAVMNAANEIAVGHFLKGGLPFPVITRTVEDTLERADAEGLLSPVTTLDEILSVDQDARRLAEEALERLC